MAIILPFTALRYNTARVRLENVLTQPYDKITPEMQERYHEASAFNLVQVELGKPSPGDNDTLNVYTRAADSIRNWTDKQVIIRDREPSVYLYSQQFNWPGQGSNPRKGDLLERRGFIALGKLCEYQEKVVFRHEQTLSKPKADRFNLLRATKTQTGQIFMLYSDPQREIDTLTQAFANSQPPTAELTDEYGVVHRLWKVSDPGFTLTLRDKMNDKNLIIADGHHRYETALAYRAERRADEIAKLLATGRTGQLSVNPQASYENLMMTFVNMDGEGILILPTHRVVSSLTAFNTDSFLKTLSEFFQVEPMPKETTIENAIERLSSAAKYGTAFVAVTKAGVTLLHARTDIADSADRFFPGSSARQRSLDVLQLHKIILEHLLGISEEQVRDQSHVRYLRDAAEAWQCVREGADVAFLMNPVPIEQMRDIAFAGEVMPQKSTDFYPKLLSGLTMYELD